jgi:hypothetical protein
VSYGQKNGQIDHWISIARPEIDRHRYSQLTPGKGAKGTKGEKGSLLTNGWWSNWAFIWPEESKLGLGVLHL